MEHHGAEPAFTSSRAPSPGGPPSTQSWRGDGAGPSALLATAVTKTYHAGIAGCSARVQALRGVDLGVQQGEAVAILGPIGSGKSTLLLCLAGILRPDGGTVAWFGRTADEGGPPPGIAYVSQHRAAYPFMTVREAIEYRAILRDTAIADRAGAIEAALEDTGLGPDAEALVSSLSTGGVARLALAQALAARPRVVLLDETMSGLLPNDRREIAVIVRRLLDRGVTVVVAADDLDAIEAVVSRIAVMLDGRLATVVAPSTLRTTRTLELTVATPVQAGRIPGSRVAEPDQERRTLRLPLEGTSPEAILARCQACGIRVVTSRVILTRDPHT